MPGLNIRREQAKAKILSQFANKDSVIKYLASAIYHPDKIRAVTVYTFSELYMNMEIRYFEENHKYSVIFTDYDEKAYNNQDNLVDLSLGISVNSIYHNFEEIVISERGIKFRVTEYCLINSDYKFELYRMTVNDWKAVEYDLSKQVMNYTLHENYNMFIEHCKKLRFDNPYHTFKLENKYMETIRSMKWFNELPLNHQEELIQIFTPLDNDKNEYFRLVRQIENFKGFSPKGYKWNRIGIFDLKDISTFEK